MSFIAPKPSRPKVTKYPEHPGSIDPGSGALYGAVVLAFSLAGISMAVWWLLGYFLRQP